jgi:enoyl-CoA hydratase
MGDSAAEPWVRVKVANKVATVELNRPAVRNAQSRELLEALDDAFIAADNNPAVNVIVLLGAGEHFSAGHDLGSEDELADRENNPWQEGLRGRYHHSKRYFLDNTLRWRNLSKPCIVGIQGYCIFAGWMIASAMDIIYAADNTLLLGSNFQYFSMPWDINPRKAKELLFDSRFIDAAEAAELGLVNKVVPASSLRAEVLAYAERIAGNDPYQLRMMKLAVNQAQDVQGFSAHLTSAHALHILSSEGEKDPDYALKVPDGAQRAQKPQRPMVQRALENYRQQKKPKQ